MLQNRLHLQFLSDDGLDQIEETAYRLLEEVGLGAAARAGARHAPRPGLPHRR